MAIQRVHLQPAFILHSRSYKESSLLLQIFSLDYGKLDLIAHGARKRKAPPQPFQPLLLSWTGRSTLQTLTQIESEDHLPALTSHYLASAFYLNELLLYLLPNQDSEPQLFNQYHHALIQLAAKAPLQATLRIFEKHLLNILGYGLNLTHEAHSNVLIKPQQHYYYQLESGAVTADQTTEGIFIHGSSLIAYAKEQLTDQLTLRELKQLMRCIIQQYLGNKPLKSRELLQWQTTSPSL